MAHAARMPRADNRLPRLLDEAARLFGERGFHGTTIRDVVRGVDMLPGSLYYHFAAKEALLAAVYAEGVKRISERVNAAIAKRTDPWQRLTAACVAHLEALLDEGAYAQVMIRVRPGDVPEAALQLTALRDRYESVFVELIDALPLRQNVDRRTLRLMLLGALNWSQTWYRPGRDDPRAIARNFVALLRRPTESQDETRRLR
jgi:TetR/AcrR family transcriptional regulator, cholesterol catabolism regulator